MKRGTISDLLISEDAHYLFLNKPPFLATLTDRNDPDNLLDLARTYEPNAQVCHRLDKDTSGVLAVARNPEAYRHMSMQFEHREVNKIYHAVVEGVHRFDNQLVDAPLEMLRDHTVKISSAGKVALTYFTSLETFKGYTLVQCRPVTGRMHQIRVHLASLGAPISGDVVYGGQPFFLSQVKGKFKLKRDADELPLISRMALHAFALEFNDLEGIRQRVEASYPKDFRVLVTQLGKARR